MSMQCSVSSSTIYGIEAIPVTVEVSVSKGMPGFTIVGMTDAAIQEARERIRSALRASGFTMPADKVVVNLAPCSLKKNGSGFDLPIAIAILAATGQIDSRLLSFCSYVGELSLEGQVRSITGILPHALSARNLGFNFCTAPSRELGVLEQTDDLIYITHLSDLRTGKRVSLEKASKHDALEVLDYADINGHDRAKRVLELSALGGHGVLFVGPPGSGKTMLAQRFPGIMKPLSEEEMLESCVIYGLAGENTVLLEKGIRPFRAPHHSASSAGLLGGGSPIRPGEISLAHNGVLFLDELAEFKPNLIQGMRQPLETGYVHIARAESSLKIPARFSLLAAMNPCPCGYLGDKEHTCECTLRQINVYQGRIGGPILDRIDMQIEISRLQASEVLQTGKGKSTAEMKAEVQQAVEFRFWRQEQQQVKTRGLAALLEECTFDEETYAYFESMAQHHSLSGRAITRVLSVARSIADLEQSNRVLRGHVSEALGYRLGEGIEK